MRLPTAHRLAGLCTATRQVTWTSRQPQAATFLYAVDLDGGRVLELAVAGRMPLAWESVHQVQTTLGTLRLEGASRRAGRTGGRPHATDEGDDDEGEERGEAAATSAASAAATSSSLPLDPLSASSRAAAAARRAAGRRDVMVEGRAGDAAGRNHKLRQRKALLSRVARHPRGDVGAALLETLELPPNAHEAAVDHAIRLVMRVLHPDYSINREERGTKLGKALQAAFQKVSDLRDRLQADREQQRAEEEAEEAR